MLNFALELLTVLSSSVIVLFLIYLKTNASLIQQALALLIIILLLALKKFVFAASKPVPYALKLLLVFIVAAFLQLLIFSSGGFYSPFLILFHLFALSAGFLFNLRTAIYFLIFSLAALSFDTFVIDKTLLEFLMADPWTAILYGLSFIVIIPLYQVVIGKYDIQATLSKILSTQLKTTGTELKLSKERESVLLEGSSDLIFVTDLDLKIISCSQSALEILSLPGTQLVGRHLFEVLNLKDSEERLVDANFLSVSKVLADGISSVTGNLLLYTSQTVFPKKVVVQVRPTTRLGDKVAQLMFIVLMNPGGESKKSVSAVNLSIYGPSIYLNSASSNSDKVFTKYQSSLEGIKNDLRDKGLLEVLSKVEILSKTQRDILTMREIEDHGIKPSLAFVDIAEIMQIIVSREQDFASGLGVKLHLSFDEQFTKQFTSVDLRKGEQIPTMMTMPYFTILSDLKWISLLTEELIDIAILLSAKEQSPWIKAAISYDQAQVTVDLLFPCVLFPPELPKMLWEENYGSLGDHTKLSLGSGLEGYIAKTISTLLKIPILLTHHDETSTASLTLQLSKRAIH